jgi:uncharacterized protein (DUF4415 family)
MKRKKKAVSGKKKVAHKLAKAVAGAIQARGRGGEDVTAKFFRLYKPRKVPITIRLDADVAEWFRSNGRGYQTRINGLLRKVMEDEAK